MKNTLSLQRIACAALLVVCSIALANSAEEVKVIKKRQLLPFAADFDYYQAFLDYAAYDYYDWVCTDFSCQLCDVLTGECCNPRKNPNCFLPDSCANNPCLSGGTCIATRTVDNNPDFACVCRGGLTGKYCQLVDEFALPPVGAFGSRGPYRTKRGISKKSDETSKRRK